MEKKSRYKPGIYRGIGEYVISIRAESSSCLEIDFLAPAFDHPKDGPITDFVVVSHVTMAARDFRRCYRRTPITKIPEGWLKPLYGMAKYLYNGGYNEVLPIILDLEARIEEVSSDRTA